jgi:hypothetical protein
VTTEFTVTVHIRNRRSNVGASSAGVTATVVEVAVFGELHERRTADSSGNQSEVPRSKLTLRGTAFEYGATALSR